MIKTTNVKLKNKPYELHIEIFDSADETVRVNRNRPITDSAFRNARENVDGDWAGVKSYSDAEELLKTGYQPTVDAMKGVWKGRTGITTRFKFQNDITGFAPVVPLAMKGVPNCMINMQMAPIKAKVLDVYYDITSSCNVESEEIIRVGQSILGSIIELEQQGYRFNLYGVQTYSDGSSCDMLVVKLKSASQPLDLKRVSFPLTHTAFFRIFGFDWYSRVPGGKHRFGYGRGMAYDYNDSELNNMAKAVFGRNSVYLSAAHVLKMDTSQIKEALTNVNSKD